MLSLGEHGEWIPPIVTTTATNNDGIDKLWDEIKNHREHMGKAKLNSARLSKTKYELENQISQKLFTKKIIEVGEKEMVSMSQDIMNRDIDPFSAV